MVHSQAFVKTVEKNFRKVDNDLTNRVYVKF